MKTYCEHALLLQLKATSNLENGAHILSKFLMNDRGELVEVQPLWIAVHQEAEGGPARYALHGTRCLDNQLCCRPVRCNPSSNIRRAHSRRTQDPFCTAQAFVVDQLLKASCLGLAASHFMLAAYRLYETVHTLQPEVLEYISQTVQPFCTLDGLKFSKPKFSHGPWKAYLVGVVGDVAAEEDNVLWPNRVSCCEAQDCHMVITTMCYAEAE